MRQGSNNGDFQGNWDEYQRGFGNVSADFWLGNERIHTLTRNTTGPTYLLRVETATNEGEQRFAQYDDFAMSGRSDGYTLSVGPYNSTSNAGEDN